MSSDNNPLADGSDYSSPLHPALASLTVQMQETRHDLAEMKQQWTRQDKNMSFIMESLAAMRPNTTTHTPPPPHHPATHYQQTTRPNDPSSIDYYGLPRQSNNTEGVFAISDHGDDEEHLDPISHRNSPITLVHDRNYNQP